MLDAIAAFFSLDSMEIVSSWVWVWVWSTICISDGVKSEAKELQIRLCSPRKSPGFRDA